MKELTTVKLSDRVKELLSYATSEHRVAQVCQDYLRLPNCKLYWYEKNNEIIGCIGLKLLQDNQGEILHIAVSPKHRGKGIGSKMINYICRTYNFDKLIAETDKDAVGFYQNYGFKITSLGEKYPGVERFLCELFLE